MHRGSCHGYHLAQSHANPTVLWWCHLTVIFSSIWKFVSHLQLFPPDLPSRLLTQTFPHTAILESPALCLEESVRTSPIKHTKRNDSDASQHAWIPLLHKELLHIFQFGMWNEEMRTTYVQIQISTHLHELEEVLDEVLGVYEKPIMATVLCFYSASAARSSVVCCVSGNAVHLQ